MNQPRRSSSSAGLLDRLIPPRFSGRARPRYALARAGKSGSRLALFGPVFPLLLLVVAFLSALITYEITYSDRIYHGVQSHGVALGGLTREQARSSLAYGASRFAATKIVIRGQTTGGKPTEWSGLPEELGIAAEVEDEVAAAWAIGREGNIGRRLGEQVAVFFGSAAPLDERFSVDSVRRSAFLATVSADVDVAPVDARLIVKPTDPPQIEIQAGKLGRRLNVEQTNRAIDIAIARLRFEVPTSSTESGDDKPAVPIVVSAAIDESLAPSVGEPALVAAAEKARKMVVNPVAVRYQGRTWTLSPKQIAESLTASGTDVSPDLDKLKKPIEAIARESATAGTSARFDYSGGVMKSIAPGQTGRKIDVAAATPAVRTAILAGSRTVDVPGAPLQPEFGSDDGGKLLALGLTLIESASTPYDAGSNDRRFNVELAASRVHGVLLLPGEVFSFNDSVGEVSYKSGYKQGYGISRNSDGDVITIPSEGGGICQVATTLFHSVFWAGYPIVERHWHSYWIPRYGLAPKGMKGLDATIDQVYDRDGKLIAEIDLRFQNSTDAPILIQARTDKKNVTFQLYGKKPDWSVKIDQPKITDVVKADTTIVRQADATLAPGAEMTIEEARDGFTAAITRSVIASDGKMIEQKTFVAKYSDSRNVIIYGPRPTPTITPVPPTATVTPTPKPGTTPKPAATATPKPATTVKPAATATPKPPVKPAATPTPRR